MATSVNTAFNQFLNDTVNVPKSQSDAAKSSRTYLIGQIDAASSAERFLKRASSYDISFGSFARKTKIRPLDDIDFLIGLNGGDLVIHGSFWNDIQLKLKPESTDSVLRGLCDENTQYWSSSDYKLNSQRVKNKLVSALQYVPQYENSEIHARGEAVTLKLKSYPWTFDIVPAFFCSATQYGKAYYLIPNGSGNWKKTNPKLEQERVSRLNTKFNNIVLNTIRLVKYWNRRGQMPNISSYILETMVLDYFEQASHYGTNSDGKYVDYCDTHFRDALIYIANNIFGSVYDPKGIQGNINNLTHEQKMKIHTRANNDYKKACNAVSAEVTENDIKKSINQWRDIFGGDFPTYG